MAFGVGVLFVALAFLHPLRAHAATITVTGNGDTIAIDGLATLREAITSINNQADVNGDVTLNRVGNYATMVGGTPDVINFNILGAGVKTISVGSALPTLTKPMTINGYSQPGASANSSQNGDNAVILIELDGTNAGGTANGLMVGAGAGGTVIEGLAINRFNGVGILVSGVSATITGNFIGTDAFGSVPFPNMNGVLLQVGATNSTVGGATAPARNLISGNSGSGVGIQGNATKGNVIEGNYIGTKADGITALGNKFGVNISGASGNTIGGTTAGAGNLISGNTNEGVLIQSSGTTGNLIEGNLIGTAYSQTLTASGGSGTVDTFTVLSGTLPVGLNLSTGGALTGTPTAAGTSMFTVQVQDSLGNTATQSYTLTITAAPLTSIALTGPGGATTLTLKVGQSASLTATGTYADHSMQTIPPGAVQWQSSNSAVVMVDASGNLTVESAGGPVTITGTFNGVTGQIIVTVSAPTPIGITVPPVPQNRPGGATSGSAPAPAPAPRSGGSPLPAVGPQSGSASSSSPAPAPVPPSR